jgi:hypothetical protein
MGKSRRRDDNSELGLTVEASAIAAARSRVVVHLDSKECTVWVYEEAKARQLGPARYRLKVSGGRSGERED